MSYSDAEEELSAKSEKSRIIARPLKSKKSAMLTTEECDEERKHSTEGSARSSCTFNMDNRLCLTPDCDSEPDRSNPLWKIVRDEEPVEELEEEPSSSADKHQPTLWEEIMIEYEDKRHEWQSFQELSKPFEPPLPICNKLSAVQYLEKHIFPVLSPALEDTLFKAKELECLMIQKCRFSGLDYIAELLWNRNPLHPNRQLRYRDIFDIPFVIIWLHYNPRPIYPLSWVWTKEEAIIVLQTYIRRYLVCREAECSEMRQFWKILRAEKAEENRVKRLKSLEKTEIMFNDLLDKLVADAVFEAEWKVHGCHCIKKPCHCVCKCMKWCKCCKCYKKSTHVPKPCRCSSTQNVTSHEYSSSDSF